MNVVNPLKTSTAPLVRARILLVEDDPDIRRLNVALLTESGYLVDAAKDGVAAWQALNLGTYNLLLTDNEMPNMTGVELIEKIHAARMPLPVIVVSGTMPTEEVQRRPWRQLHPWLMKPYSIMELLAAVKEALRDTGGNGEHIVTSPD